MNGNVVKWNDERGFGFIQTGDGTHYYFHISDVISNIRPANGDPAILRAGRGNNGKIAAREVELQLSKKAKTADGRTNRHASTRTSIRWRWVLVLVIIGGLGWGLFAQVFPPYLPLAYALMGLCSFMTYAYDKRASQSGAWRVRESTLMLLDFCVGILGGLVAQELLRHKTLKANFIVAGVVVGGLHIALLVALILGVFEWP